MIRIFKTNPVLTIVNSYLVDSPQPSTISYLWNFGSLLGLCLVTQLVTGIILGASVRIFIEFIFMIHTVDKYEEYEAYLIGVDNLIIRKNKGTKACFERVDAEVLIIGTSFLYSKIPFKLISYFRLTLILWNVNFFWYNTIAEYKELNLQQWWGSLSSARSDKVYLLLHNYLLALGTGNESTTMNNKYYFRTFLLFWNNTLAINVTGEIHYSKFKSFRIMEVRGFIVVRNDFYKIRITKETKYRLALNRSYTTYSTKQSNSSETIMSENSENNLGFERIARLWISNYKKPTKIYKSLKIILNTKELWYASYIKVRSSKGSETPGIDLKTLDGTTKTSIDSLREKVMGMKYNWNPIRRVEIPKSFGKTRPLGIPTLDDRIVQEVLRTILEPLFEPSFSDKSHGFRPGRSCHTALKYVNTQFKGVSWYIEGDISKYFDSINHNILMHLLKRKVRDKLILNLIEAGLKADIIFKNKTIEHISGTPQGGILSPLLSNIYLHELDKFINNLEDEYLGPSKRVKVNPEYTKLINRNRKGWDPKNSKKARKLSYKYPFDSMYRYIRYVRYADDFLIGVVGPRKIALEIRERIREFLETKLTLELNLEKTKITHISRKIPFLGYLIGRRVIWTKQHYGRNKRYVNRKMVIPTLDGNVEKMIRSLAKNNFCDNSGFSKPNFNLLMLPQSEINQKINSIILGISNWWAIAGNRRQGVARISYILRFSAAKLYAAKYKLRSIGKVFKKGGKGLNKPLSSNKGSVVGVTDERIMNWFNQKEMNSAVKGKTRKIQPILYVKYKDIPKHEGNKLKPDWKPEFVNKMEDKEFIKLLENNKLISYERNPLILLGQRMSKGIKVLGEPCFVCKSKDNVEMHHVKSLKLLKPLKNMIKDRQRAILRKQIPLCRKHHLQIHNYNWRNPAIPIKYINIEDSFIKPNEGLSCS